MILAPEPESPWSAAGPQTTSFERSQPPPHLCRGNPEQVVHPCPDLHSCLPDNSPRHTQTYKMGWGNVDEGEDGHQHNQKCNDKQAATINGDKNRVCVRVANKKRRLDRTMRVSPFSACNQDHPFFCSPAGVFPMMRVLGQCCHRRKTENKTD